MKEEIERRKPEGLLDYLSLAVTTFGVGYFPGAPGTYGSVIGAGIYLLIDWFETSSGAHGISVGLTPAFVTAFHFAVNTILLIAFALICIWAAGRATELLGNTDPPQAVVDEVLGQLVTFAFVPFGIGWPLVLAGFLLFRLFDIWKPYPIDSLQVLPGGIGVCADDILAGVYAGVCLSIIYAVSLSI